MPNLTIIPRTITRLIPRKPANSASFDVNIPGSNDKFITPSKADKKIKFDDFM